MSAKAACTTAGEASKGSAAVVAPAKLSVYVPLAGGVTVSTAVEASLLPSPVPAPSRRLPKESLACTVMLVAAPTAAAVRPAPVAVQEGSCSSPCTTVRVPGDSAQPAGVA
eukprot:5684-Heterococcus_DN1.PRE.1